MLDVLWDVKDTRRWAEQCDVPLIRIRRPVVELRRVGRTRRVLREETTVDVCPGYVFVETLPDHPAVSPVRVVSEGKALQIEDGLIHLLTIPHTRHLDCFSGSEQFAVGDVYQGTGSFEGLSGTITAVSPLMVLFDGWRIPVRIT